MLHYVLHVLLPTNLFSLIKKLYKRVETFYSLPVYFILVTYGTFTTYVNLLSIAQVVGVFICFLRNLSVIWEVPTHFTHQRSYVPMFRRTQLRAKKELCGTHSFYYIFENIIFNIKTIRLDNSNNLKYLLK